MGRTSETVISKGKRFSIDARAMLTWGRDSIKDHSTAVLELVKNSYDAGATVVVVTIVSGESSSAKCMIRIADDGAGMSNKEVSNKWLRIGYSDKRTDKSVRGRRKAGEKGIGRISADRLGSVLELRTQCSADDAVGLGVNWDLFEHSGVDLNTIELHSLDNLNFLVPRQATYNEKRDKFEDPPKPRPNSRKVTGTELTIRNLRQRWTPSDVEDLRNELSVLTSPLKRTEDFQIRLINDVSPARDGVITSPF